MKILAISDTHNYIPRFSEMPKGIDLIIHAGDATSTGQPSQYMNFIEKWEEIMKKRHIPKMLFVPGNHDKNWDKCKELFDNSNIHCETSGIWNYEGIDFACSSTTKIFMGWAFEKNDEDRLIEFKRLLMERPDVLVTHTPPFGVMDLVNNYRKEYCGCHILRNLITNYKPDIHIFGHIHEGHGSMQVEDTMFYNVAYCDESYNPINNMTIIEYNKDK